MMLHLALDLVLKALNPSLKHGPVVKGSDGQSRLLQRIWAEYCVTHKEQEKTSER